MGITAWQPANCLFHRILLGKRDESILLDGYQSVAVGSLNGVSIGHVTKSAVGRVAEANSHSHHHTRSFLNFLKAPSDWNIRT